MNRAQNLAVLTAASLTLLASNPSLAVTASVDANKALFETLERVGAEVETRLSDYFAIQLSSVSCSYAPHQGSPAQCMFTDDLNNDAVQTLNGEAAADLYAALVQAGAPVTATPVLSLINLAAVRCLFVDDGRHPARYECVLAATTSPQVLNPSDDLIDVGEPRGEWLLPEPVQGLNPDFGR